MEKTMGEVLKEKLFNENKYGFELVSEEEKKDIFDFCEGYIDFLNICKTERESVKEVIRILDKNGFKNIESMSSLSKGDKVYYNNRNKAIYASVIGNIEKGFNIIGSHIDSPRLDLKPNPLYEDTGMAFLKTHYYGGIKTYQWVNIPLSIHGVFAKASGEVVEVNIGEEENDPVFTINDLLPHLSKVIDDRKAGDAIEAEELNILVGTIPFKDDKVKEKVKLNILSILNEKYGITESDFTSAELELVPAFKAKSLGFDRSMISAYGQDDRVCAYTSLKALLSTENPERSAVCIFADKEEIGSVGNTGMYSRTFDNFINLILEKTNNNKFGMLEKVLCNSRMLSADVTGAYEPNFSTYFEKNNESYTGKGISIIKYTGSASKGGASDANAEYVGFIRNLFENNNIAYQVSEMGKIGVGGGGTIAYILANKGIDVIDCGVPVLAMHSPYEVTSKFDVYTAYKAYEIFYKN